MLLWFYLDVNVDGAVNEVSGTEDNNDRKKYVSAIDIT